jgi:hypothetical protein
MASKHPMLDGNVDEKDYGKINIAMTEEEKNTPIPEPAYQAPPFVMEEEEEPTATTISSEPKEKKEREPFNENLDEMSTSEKKKQAESMANMAIDVYSYLNKVVGDLCKINEAKAKEAHINGDINLYATIRFDDGSRSIKTIEQIIVEYNSGTSDVLTVSEEFKENVRPLLTRILQKKGIGLTDEELLAYYVVMDLVQKAPVVFQLAKQKKNMYDKLVEISKRPSNTVVPPSVPTAEQPPTQQPQQDAPKSNPAPSPLADSEGGSLTIEDDEPKKRRGRKPNVKP